MKAYKMHLKLSLIGRKKNCRPHDKEPEKAFARECNLSFNTHLKENGFLFD